MSRTVCASEPIEKVRTLQPECEHDGAAGTAFPRLRGPMEQIHMSALQRNVRLAQFTARDVQQPEDGQADTQRVSVFCFCFFLRGESYLHLFADVY